MSSIQRLVQIGPVVGHLCEDGLTDGRTGMRKLIVTLQNIFSETRKKVFIRPCVL
jgi:hypothetical protein